jgi:AP-2 complex subunit sigma-1
MSTNVFSLVGPQFKNHKIVYRRYAGLFFCVCVDANDNELAYLEAIHLFVEILGKPFVLSAYFAYLLADTGLWDTLKIPSSTTCASWISFLISTRSGAFSGLDASLVTHRSNQVYAILDEIFLAGEIEETSKDVVLARLEELEKLE